MEAEALLQIQVDEVAVVVEIPDRQVLAGHQVEIVTALADHDCTADAGGPDEGTLDDLSQVLEQWIAAVLGRLDDTPVLIAAERERVRTVDPAVEQAFDRRRDGPRVRVGLGAELDLVRGAAR